MMVLSDNQHGNHMNKIKQIVIAVSLAACAGVAPVQAKEAPVQDGIQVRPMPRYRELASQEQMEQQAQQHQTQSLSCG